jgi:hypothetical protein
MPIEIQSVKLHNIGIATLEHLVHDEYIVSQDLLTNVDSNVIEDIYIVELVILVYSMDEVLYDTQMIFDDEML